MIVSYILNNSIINTSNKRFSFQLLFSENSKGIFRKKIANVFLQNQNLKAFKQNTKSFSARVIKRGPSEIVLFYFLLKCVV